MSPRSFGASCHPGGGSEGHGPCGWTALSQARAAVRVCLILFLSLLATSPASGGRADPGIRVSSGDAFLLADPDGKILLAQGETSPLIPASTLKLFTGLMALETLGPDYRFRTSFFLDSRGNLKIKGYGDPLLVSEAWDDLARTLSTKIKSFKDLILDTTYFSPDIPGPGKETTSNPYDAPVGALCANFNTLFFHTDQQGRLASSEPQTPLLPFVLAPLRAMGVKEGRYTLSHDPVEVARYAGELALHFLKKAGIATGGKVRLGPIEESDRPLTTWYSPFPLREVIGKCLAYSSNFMANQVFLGLGAERLGPPATLAKSVSLAMDYARGRLGIRDLTIEEGSGLSRGNRISAVSMHSVLRRFTPYAPLLRQEGQVLYKTGTLKGIRTRAGYMKDGKEALFPFVVLLNHQPHHMERTLEGMRRRVSGGSEQ